MKICTKCGVPQSLEEFARRGDVRDGRASHCKTCKRAYQKSLAGKAAQARYSRSAKGRATNRRYERTKKGKNNCRRYQTSPKGKATKRRSYERAKAVPEKHQKMLCRSRTRSLIRAGKLQKSENCEFCGEQGQVESHHLDYSKPWDLIWLCPRCHRAEHIKKGDDQE